MVIKLIHEVGSTVRRRLHAWHVLMRTVSLHRLHTLCTSMQLYYRFVYVCLSCYFRKSRATTYRYCTASIFQRVDGIIL